MILQDKEQKKQLDEIPETDESGEPIYKIDNADPSQKNTGELPETPLFLENNFDSPQGNKQDIKDSTEE